MNLPVDPSTEMPVRFGDGKDSTTSRVVKSAPIKFGFASFHVTIFLFPMSGVDIILGFLVGDTR